jgi:hypothetical protein
MQRQLYSGKKMGRRTRLSMMESIAETAEARQHKKRMEAQ